MATAQEKEALGLKSGASDEDVIRAIQALSAEPEAGEVFPGDVLREELNLEADASDEDVQAALASLKEQADNPSGQPVSTPVGLQSLAEALNTVIEVNGETAKRTIRHKAFSYRVLIDSPVDPNKKVFSERLARRGETVALLADDIERGERHSAFETERTKAEDKVKELDAAEMSDGDLIRAIKDRGLTVNQTVALSKGDSDQAKRLLDAENSATGNDPRRGVVEGLTAVIGQTR